ncbi:MAG TPA: hypothetical protein VN577_11020 [Terriglobales bacterium]|nr:hypothetical protein [Terriglobales bacterium]
MTSAETMALSATAVRAGRAAFYTSADEFCTIFNRDMDSLFQLAMVLTGDEAKAQKCFLAALEKCRKSTTVFRDWARSWARIAVIENAIEMIGPSAGKMDTRNAAYAGASPEFDLVLRLDTFARFVFVLTVLNQFTIQDAAILLKCRPQEVENAKLRAMEILGRNAAETIKSSAMAAHRLAS